MSAAAETFFVKYYDEFRVTAEAEWIGMDLSVRIFGGDRSHIGSVAIAEPRQSLLGDGRISSTVSVINYCGHKDEIVARPCAERLCSEFACNTVVLCGIHYEVFDPELARRITDLTDLICEDIMRSGRS